MKKFYSDGQDMKCFISQVQIIAHAVHNVYSWPDISLAAIDKSSEAFACFLGTSNSRMLDWSFVIKLHFQTRLSAYSYNK